jgi:hypothetical protein
MYSRRFYKGEVDRTTDSESVGLNVLVKAPQSEGQEDTSLLGRQHLIHEGLGLASGAVNHRAVVAPFAGLAVATEEDLKRAIAAVRDERR